MNVLLRPPKLHMTADEFYEFVHRPENETRAFELVRGEVMEVARPTRIHGRICSNVVFQLELYVRAKKKGYIVCNDTGVLLEEEPDTVRGPDVAYYDDVERFEDLPKKWGTTIPRLIVEVRSPNDTDSFIEEKVRSFHQSGVELVWVVDSDVRTVTIHAPGKEPKVLTEKSTLTGGAVLPGFRCKVADFFYIPAGPTKKKAKRKSP